MLLRKCVNKLLFGPNPMARSLVRWKPLSFKHDALHLNIAQFRGACFIRIAIDYGEVSLLACCDGTDHGIQSDNLRCFYGYGPERFVER